MKQVWDSFKAQSYNEYNYLLNFYSGYFMWFINSPTL